MSTLKGDQDEASAPTSPDFLLALHSSASAYLKGLPRAWIERLPDSKRMIQLRYGKAPAPSLQEFSAIYRTTLQIVASVVEPLAVFRLGKAQLKIRTAPWLKAK